VLRQQNGGGEPDRPAANNQNRNLDHVHRRVFQEHRELGDVDAHRQRYPRLTPPAGGIAVCPMQAAGLLLS